MGKLEKGGNEGTEPTSFRTSVWLSRISLGLQFLYPWDSWRIRIKDGISKDQGLAQNYSAIQPWYSRLSRVCPVCGQSTPYSVLCLRTLSCPQRRIHQLLKSPPPQKLGRHEWSPHVKIWRPDLPLAQTGYLNIYKLMLTYCIRTPYSLLITLYQGKRVPYLTGAHWILAKVTREIPSRSSSIGISISISINYVLRSVSVQSVSVSVPFSWFPSHLVLLLPPHSPPMIGSSWRKLSSALLLHHSDNCPPCFSSSR